MSVAIEPCARCESLPSSQMAALCVWLPTGHLERRVAGQLRQHGVDVCRGRGHLAVTVDDATALAGLLLEVTSPTERRDTRSLLLDAAREPAVEDFGRVQTLEQAIGTLQASWLLCVLEEKRLVPWFQPLVDARNPAHIVAHEALIRGLDPEGRPIYPGQLFGTARRADLTFQLDVAARLAAVRGAADHGLATDLFVNFTPTSVYDPSFCLRSTVAAVAEAGLDPRRVVFEVVESERVDDVDHLRRIVERYQASGFRVALDDVGSGFSSLNLLGALKPDIVKLDMELIRDAETDAYKGRIVRGLVDAARDNGVTVVAEGVETPDAFHFLAGLGVDLIQGYLLQRPRPAPTPAIDPAVLASLRRAA